MMAPNGKTLYDEYQAQGEPLRSRRAYNWSTAIGLQAVDALQTSDYLQQLARENIEGKIDVAEAKALIRSYYETRSRREQGGEDTQEADKVAANIADILSTDTFAFNANGFISLHRRIFEGVFPHAGTLRKVNLTKKEWVLRGDTVHYLNWEDLFRALTFDMEQERQFRYAGLSSDQIVSHIAHFVSGLWQIHPFREGNTRTTAVFAVQYLRAAGFHVNNDLFARYAWYFRNALVRANYRNAQLGIEYDSSFLELFFRNLLLNEKNELRNRYMLINTASSSAFFAPTEQVPNKYRTSS